MITYWNLDDSITIDLGGWTGAKQNHIIKSWDLGPEESLRKYA